MHADLGLGKIIDRPQQRDAIHVAVAPIVAADNFKPAQHIGLDAMGRAVDRTPYIGIVDPYLLEGPREGQKFWLFLYPNTVTGLRHDWSHPAFGAIVGDKEASMRWMEEFAAKHYSSNEQFEIAGYGSGYNGTGRCYTVDEIIEYAKDFLLTGDKHVQQGSESLRDDTRPEEFWPHFEAITGMKVADYHRDQVPFCCTC